MPFSPTLELILTLATREAARSEFAAIEPDHLLLGLLKFADLDLDHDVLGNAGFDPTARERIDAERREIGQWLQQRGLEATALRRQLRRALGTSNQLWPARGLQFSPATETRLQQAQTLAGGEGRDQVTAIHLLRALFEPPTPLLAQRLAELATMRVAPRLEQDVAEMVVRHEDLAVWAGAGQPAVPRLDVLTETVTRLRDRLRAQVFGQDHAIQAFVEGLFNAEVVAGVEQDRRQPEAVFVFAGPPGVGKTFLAEEGARALGRPFHRFDMSAYSGPQAGETLIGVHRSFHGAHAGLLTGFVVAHPNAVLLFDEIEKAHLHTLHLFLQVLDVGTLEDQFTERTIDFRETLLIFTTNAGRMLYDRPEANALRHAPPEFHRRTLLGALESEIDPRTGAPVFPPALCSRLATGYPVLFGPLGVNELERVAAAALRRQAELLATQYGKRVEFGPTVPLCLVLREGVATEARTVRAQAENFLKSELLKFAQLYRRERLEPVWRHTARLAVDLDPASLADPEARALLEPSDPPRVLLIADERLAALWPAELPGVVWRTAGDRAGALAALAGGEIDWVLLNLWLASARQGTVLQFDRAPATARALAPGLEILRALHERYPQAPCFLLSFVGEAPDYFRLDEELLLTCARQGARGVLETAFVSRASLDWREQRAALAAELERTASYLYRERQARALGAAYQVLIFDTTPEVVDEARTVRIRLRNLRLTQAVAAADVGAVLAAVERPEVGFAQVFGADAAKAELGFIVRWLRDPRRYQGLGLRPPRGILLHGPPGAGKTLLARALAGESRVAFLEASAAHFVTVWQGSGPQNVRELFARARRYAPAIVFLDEIDAVGKQRIGSTRPTEETLNALLTEMDGFRTPAQPPVVVIAATNQVELLDEALRRRFDREVEVDKPDRRARAAYLRQRLRGMSAGAVSDAAIEALAARSAGLTIVGLERVVAQAGRLAVEGEGAINDALLEEAFARLQLGEARALSDPAGLLRVARHEAGHGLIGWLAGRKPVQISILARGRVGGSVESEPDEERLGYTRAELESRIRQALGGRAAELLYYGERDGPSTSAVGDLRAATRYAEQMVRDYGMDEGIGPLVLAPDQWEQGPLAAQAVQAVQRIVKDQLALALEELRVHRPALDRLVEALQARNRVTREELEELLTGLS